ncbi:MAG: alpha/beta hydrolase [Treponema sp.]|nr:alpha/beta hydrolase [Treponema sp.]MEE0893656.1 alpha/beta hydrolase [Treponema sp.]
MEIKQDRKAALKKIKTLSYSQKVDTESFRKKIEETFSTDYIPGKVEITEKEFGGVSCSIICPELFSANRAMIYIHGGNFIAGSRQSWTSFCSTFATATSTKIILPEFRLAPEHPFPAQAEDIENVFKSVLLSEKINLKMNSTDDIDIKEDKEKPEIIIAADSTGASIALSFLLGLDKKYLSEISKIILLSPILEYSFDDATVALKKLKDEVTNAESIRQCACMYTYESNISSYSVSPIKAEDSLYEGFPEFYIQCGAKELMLPYNKQFELKLARSGVKCTLDIVEDMMFLFQLADESLMEAYESITRIGDWINFRGGETKEEIEERKRLIKENNITVE